MMCYTPCASGRTRGASPSLVGSSAWDGRWFYVPAFVWVVSKALQVRLQHQINQGRKVSLSEVAEKAGVDRGALTRLEQGSTECFDGDMIAKLCGYYGVGVGDLLEYDPNMQEAGYAAGALLPA
jgi:DNA-binding Xre family transcriptional regulator